MIRKYPKITSYTERQKNTQALCKCGQVAKFKTEIQVNYFRGDDEYFWTCEEHKKDLDFIMKAGVK